MPWTIRPGAGTVNGMARPRNELIASTFGSVVKGIRLEANLSQEQLANVAGIDRRTIGRIESGQHQPTLSVLFSIAQAVSVAPHVLVKKLEAGLGP
jgi:XRE family transcriptional regulator, regulator of sulfur utilization